ncbi:hypothetical protein EXQ31_10625, partial [Clostridium botulinum]|nr:hypothetical protein [Clostridium botulinum]
DIFYISKLHIYIELYLYNNYFYKNTHKKISGVKINKRILSFNYINSCVNSINLKGNEVYINI